MKRPLEPSLLALRVPASHPAVRKVMSLTGSYVYPYPRRPTWESNPSAQTFEAFAVRPARRGPVVSRCGVEPQHLPSQGWARIRLVREICALARSRTESIALEVRCRIPSGRAPVAVAIAAHYGVRALYVQPAPSVNV